MITLPEIGPDVLAYRADGKIERADIERVLDDFDRRLESSGTIRVYAEVPSLGGMSMDALWSDLRGGLKRLGDLSRIEKAALVTDVGWLRTAAGVEGKVLPGLELRVFSMAEQAEARTWILG